MDKTRSSAAAERERWEKAKRKGRVNEGGWVRGIETGRRSLDG